MSQGWGLLVMLKHSLRIIAGLSLVLSLLLGSLPFASSLTAAQAGKTINLEIIVDQSGSMAAATDTGVLRIDAAKNVLNEVIAQIPEAEGVNVGFRVYGHRGNNQPEGQAESCVSSDLLVPMQGVDKASLTAQVDALVPIGWTPLGYALEQAGADFTQPASEDVVNAIIMVTDGLETCGADPAAIAGTLKNSEAGITTHVIGFGTRPEELTILEAITQASGGQLLGSNNAGQLMNALFEILEELEVVAETGTGEARSSPLGIGRIGQVGDYEVSVITVTPYATDLVMAENQFNESPLEGNQFFMARVSVTYTGAATGTPWVDLNFQAVGNKSTSYTTFNNSCGTYPDAPFNIAELFEGGSVEFNVCWQIDSTDQDSLVMYVDPLLSFDSEPVWFSLGNPIEEIVDPNASPVPTSAPTVSPTATSAPITGSPTQDLTSNSRTNPVQMMTSAQIEDYEVSVISVTPNATDLVLAENQFNAPPTAGNQFFMARIVASYTGTETGTPWLDLNFQTVGDKNVSYTTFNNSCGTYPDQPYDIAELFEGGSVEFNVCWQIDSLDQDSLVMYVESLFSFDSDPVWFSLDENYVASTAVPTAVSAESVPADTSQVPLTLSAIDIAYSEPEITIPANTDVQLTVVNEGMLQHNFVIDDPAFSSGALNSGESATITLNLPPGTYQYYCSIPGHKEAGMVGTLIVE
jgi:plastocyanin